MFLSNLPRPFLALIVFTLVMQACSSSPHNENREVSLTGESTGEFPFAVKEPETYQADVVVTAGGAETRWAIARNGEKRRYDIYAGSALTVSLVRGDKLYYVDHRNKTFREMSEKQGPGEIGDIAHSFFRGYEHYDIDESGRESGIAKYTVRQAGQNGSIIISFDSPSGMIVKQEFLAADGSVLYVYELKNLKLAADESVFAIPPGYQRTAATEKTK